MSLEESLKTHLPQAEYDEVRRILYGKPSTKLELPDSEKIADAEKFEFKAYSMAQNAATEQGRRPNVTRIGLIQNRIHESTSAPINSQFDAIYNRVEKMIEAAAASNVNVLCLQEAWTMPFAFCTREKQPWMEFAECAETGKRSIVHNVVFFCLL